ncbi:hypothetical protein KIW84_051665 [Lathyrus oleraceus]|uniref:Uncharacterized protein n=1 Tax=Pisum sativum TaxID=3888 RepID=A0A9D4WMP6_PEA|nr:hypothetical protein KIW84_051665 [Pisum sativum]
MGIQTFFESWVIESLPGILKFLKLDHEEKFRVQKEIPKFMAVQVMFTVSLGTEVTSFELDEKFRWPKSPTSNALCKMCIKQLQLLLANAHKGGVHALAAAPNHNIVLSAGSDGKVVPVSNCSILNKCNSCLQDKFSPAIPFLHHRVNTESGGQVDTKENDETVLAAAQTLCEIKTRSQRQSSDGILRRQRKPSHKAMKTCYLKPKSKHRIKTKKANKVDKEIFTVKKQLPSSGGHSSLSWGLQKQLPSAKFNMKSGHSETFVSAPSGLPKNSNSLAARMRNQSSMPHSTIGSAKVMGQQQFDSEGAKSPSEQSPLQQQSLSVPAITHHAPSVRNLAEQDCPQTLKTFQHLGGPQSQYIKDSAPATRPNVQA